jgi:hypothetical protein
MMIWLGTTPRCFEPPDLRLSIGSQVGRLARLTSSPASQHRLIPLRRPAPATGSPGRQLPSASQRCDHGGGGAPGLSLAVGRCHPLPTSHRSVVTGPATVSRSNGDLEGRHSHPHIGQSGWTDRTPSPGENLGYLTARSLGVLPVGASAAPHDAALQLHPADHHRGTPQVGAPPERRL